MSRSGYTDDYCEDYWAHIRWRGAVNSAMRGKKGQAFFKELLAALDAMPVKRLIAKELVVEKGDTPQVCAIGAICVARGIDTSDFDIYDYDRIAEALKVNAKIVQEVEWENDEGSVFHSLWQDIPWVKRYPGDTPPYPGKDAFPIEIVEEKRWELMRDWVVSQIKEEKEKK